MTVQFMQVFNQKIMATLIVVDVKDQVALFGRDWMVSFGLDLPILLRQTLQVCYTTSGTTVTESLMSDFSDVFKEELGILHGIEATGTNCPTSILQKSTSTFCLKRKVEKLLKTQVEQGELRPVDRSDWATPIVVIPNNDGGIYICGDLKSQSTQ